MERGEGGWRRTGGEGQEGEDGSSKAVGEGEVKEQRRHWEGTRTLQELGRKKRMREVCEEAAGVAAKRCKAGGFFPQVLITQVAAGMVAQSRAVSL